ncbi:hypothetical protein X975_23477, partial [Stegodyphus mimosarum]
MPEALKNLSNITMEGVRSQDNDHRNSLDSIFASTLKS